MPAATGEDSDFFRVDTCAADQLGELLLFEAPTVIYVGDHLFENSPTTARGPSRCGSFTIVRPWSAGGALNRRVLRGQHECPERVTSSGLITSGLGQVSLTKPTYRRIVLRCCSVPQVKPSPDYEYRISLRPYPVDHPSSSTRDSASRAVPSSIRVRRDGSREAGEWQQAGGDQRDRAAQKVFARAGSRKPRSDQHQECSTTDNHGYRHLACRHPIKVSSLWISTSGPPPPP